MNLDPVHTDFIIISPEKLEDYVYELNKKNYRVIGGYPWILENKIILQCILIEKSHGDDVLRQLKGRVKEGFDITKCKKK